MQLADVNQAITWQFSWSQGNTVCSYIFLAWPTKRLQEQTEKKRELKKNRKKIEYLYENKELKDSYFIIVEQLHQSYSTCISYHKQC